MKETRSGKLTLSRQRASSLPPDSLLTASQAATTLRFIATNAYTQKKGASSLRSEPPKIEQLAGASKQRSLLLKTRSHISSQLWQFMPLRGTLATL